MSTHVGVHNVISITRNVDEYHGKDTYASTMFKFKCKSPCDSHTETFELTFFGPIGLEIEDGTTTIHGKSLASEDE